MAGPRVRQRLGRVRAPVRIRARPGPARLPRERLLALPNHLAPRPRRPMVDLRGRPATRHRMPPLLRPGLHPHRPRPDRPRVDRAGVVAGDDGRPPPRLGPHRRADADPAAPQRGQPPAAPVDLAIQPPRARAREHIARRILGMGDIRMSGTMPSGQVGILMPQRMYFIGQAAAVLDGEDLGQPVRVRPNPRMGQVPLPARGVLAVGQAAWPTLERARAHA